MIRPLRRRHVRMLAALAVVLPLLVGTVLLSRPAPATLELPAELVSAEVDLPAMLNTLQLPTDPPIHVEVRGDQASPTRLGVYLAPEADLLIPDVLVYWDLNPELRYLLGTLRGATPQTYALPDTALTAGGRLVLYSLARQEEITSIDLPHAKPTP